MCYYLLGGIDVPMGVGLTVHESDFPFWGSPMDGILGLGFGKLTSLNEKLSKMNEKAERRRLLHFNQHAMDKSAAESMDYHQTLLDLMAKEKRISHNM